MQADRDGARLAGELQPLRGGDPERDDERQQEQRHDPRSSASGTRRADRSAGRAQRLFRPRAPSGQPGVVTTVPSGRTRRAGSRWRSSQRERRSPRTIAAVLAVFAATQVDAATVTVRQVSAAGRPVRGSTMWWRSPPAARQRRTAVLDVASPPSRIETTGPGASGPARWSSAIRTVQPPPGEAPATARSPPRETRTPAPVASWTRRAQRSAAKALAVEPRSSSTPGGMRTRPRVRSTVTRRQPAAGTISIAVRLCSPRRRRRSRDPSRARACARPTVGSTSPPRRGGRVERDAERVEQERAGGERAARRSGSAATARSRRGSGCRRGRARGARARRARPPRSSASARVTVTCASTPIAAKVCGRVHATSRQRSRSACRRRAGRPGSEG